MADKDQDDEYKFDELDNYENNSLENNDFGSNNPPPESLEPTPPRKDVKRNALIAVVVIVVVLVLYKLLGALFSGKNRNESKEKIPSIPVAQIVPTTPTVQPEIAPQPVQQVVQPVVKESPVLKEKVDAIETSQQNVQTQVASLNDQITNVNNNVSNLSAQVNKLNQTLSDITLQLAKQSEEINLLMERTKPKIIRHVTRPNQLRQPNIYYINAVIPGRAWLIGTNGSTLTVREGTKIAGYGMVRLIDSMEGRILTSSGRIIKFSQDDS